MVNPKYQEILKLHVMLLDKSIPHVIERDLDGWHISYPWVGKERVLSAVEFKGTHGAEQDLIEIMGLLTPGEFLMDSVKGYLTAENVFNRIKEHYEEHKDEYYIYERAISYDCWRGRV